ncbi:p24-capsid [Adoxophyes orana granulovirus]|uniref:p24 n=1 Tax=Adoxophyes orana granulovirus TaxID=170617 RepID=Q7T9V5_GVAO|nr:p24-capsid [Adoxophyes orana granulovirus]AAP85697.1 p24-capsid [Adoxophyes orana granulovirus]AJA91699.1 P24 [Adoxophyes orana granulovirus]
MSFDYSTGQIEVFIVSNDDNTINGYAEVNSVAQLLTPFIRVTPTQIWNNTIPSYRIQNDNKNFVHAIVICKYISSITASDSQNYLNLKQLIKDLFVGDQIALSDESKLELQKINDTLNDINSKVDNYNNTLSDVNSLLKVFKSELLNELINGAPNE